MSATNVNFAAAYGAGVVSFLSPCVLPIVPGYLSMITGLEVAEIQARRASAPERHRPRHQPVHRRVLR